VAQPKRVRVPSCPYCGRDAVFVPSAMHIYGRDYGPIWECSPCEAWVGCHQGTMVAFGTPANAVLRQLRQKVHRVFDQRWKPGGIDGRKARRDAAYKWMGEMLNLSPDRWHIGMLNEDECRRLLAVLEPAPVTTWD
jgi:zinc-finger-containing domain